MSTKLQRGCISQRIVERQKGFITEWDCSVTKTITLPLYNSGTFNCVVDWGDGSGLSIITSYNDSDRIHTYANYGTYRVEIIGSCPSWSFGNVTSSNLLIKKVITWGHETKFNGFGYLISGFGNCNNLTTIPDEKLRSNGSLINVGGLFGHCHKLETIPTGIFDNLIGLTGSAFSATFYNCRAITTIPTDLFKYNTGVSTYGFNDTFAYCSALTSIPTDLFRYNTAVSTSGFKGCFGFCTVLESIPTDLFKYNTLVSTDGFGRVFQYCRAITTIPTDLFRYSPLVSGYGFWEAFAGCSALATIPTDLFRYNTAVSFQGFYATFAYCTSLTTIPTDLFRYNVNASIWSFRETFAYCTALTTIPTDLFRYNTAVGAGAFYYTFVGCTSLESVPFGLFKYNTNSVSFTNCFDGCIKLQLNKWIFFLEGEESTRFLNKSCDFTGSFKRTSYTGIQGEAPELWNCTYGTGNPTKTDCFDGIGNNETSLLNYANIPTAWI